MNKLTVLLQVGTLNPEDNKSIIPLGYVQDDGSFGDIAGAKVYNLDLKGDISSVEYVTNKVKEQIKTTFGNYKTGQFVARFVNISTAYNSL